MWLLTDVGFVTLIQHQDDASILQVRARIREDILALFPNAEVFESDGADYLYRANISRDEVANVMWEKVMTLDTVSHVKDVAIQRSAPAQGRSSAYYATWTAMSKMQPVPPYHKKNAGKGQLSFGSRWGDWDDADRDSRFYSTTTKETPETTDVTDEVADRPVTKQDIDALYGTPVGEPVDKTFEIQELADPWADAVCQETFDDPQATCSECGHTAIVHPGLNDIEGCVLCEIDHAYFDSAEESA